jgi:putative ABC transport system permease protein
MLGNYIKLAFRNLNTNRLYAFLNISGLAIGLAAGVLVLFWVADELKYDTFHRNLSEIHLILQNQTQGGVTYTFESTPGPLAAALRSEIPEIKKAARCSWNGQHLLNYGDQGIYERGMYAEPDFFSILDFPALQGDPVEALRDAGNVVITERTARKLFGNENPIGKLLRHNNQHNLKVAAVVQDIPHNSTVRFGVVLPFRIYEQENTDWINDSWGNNALPTWVSLEKDVDIQGLNKKLENFVQGKNPDAAAHVFAYPLERWRLWNRFSEGQQNGGRIHLLILLGVIGAFVLLIGCINFMNLATARSEKRAREVGVRKTMGAQRRWIIGQFLSESMVMAFLSLGLALLFTWAALPQFNRFFDKNIAISASPWYVWAGVLGLGLLTGLVAGSYPAFYLSRFQAARVMKAGMSGNGKGNGTFRKALVTVQFVISIFLMVCTIVLFRQIHHVQARPLGYEQENLLEIPARGDMSDHYETLRNDLVQIPGVNGVTAASDNMVNMGSNTSGIRWPGKTDDQDFLVTMLWVRHDWVKTTGIQLREGRDFSREYGADTMACLLNRTAVQRMGLKEPVVGTVLQHDTTMTVVGVIEDFVFNNPEQKTNPLIVYLGTGGMSSFFVRISNNQQWQQTISAVEAAFKKHLPAYPFEARFTKDEYQRGFEEVKSVSQMAVFFGGIAIFISCLGLFGLSAFTAERRKKEIGIRKTLGATVQQIWLRLSLDFFKPVVLAFAIAAPLAGLAMRQLLSTLDYHIALEWWMFAAAGLIALLVALFTVSFQGIKAALANPVKALKTE